MHAEIIALGSELTSGARLDTNSQWLSAAMAAVGIPMQLHTKVADDRQTIVSVLQAAVARSDILLLTGGLGPTLDDLTRQALADLTGTALVVHEPSLQFIEQLFQRRNREMPQQNVVQAMFPEGSEPIPNPRGTAPGIWLEIPRDASRTPCRIAALPGVPSEMKRMFQHEVLPRLPGGGSQVIRQARLNCFGVGESRAEEMLGDVTARGRDPEVGITVHEATITLRITAHGQSETECLEKIEATKTTIRERLGDLVFGEEDEGLQDVLVRMLSVRHQTLSTAESGTGGLLAHWLTEVDGFEATYRGGVVAPTDSAKQDLLNVDRSLLSRSGAVSTEVASAMANGCRDRFHTDFALAVTECPRFDPDDTQADMPVAYLALATQTDVETRQLTLGGDPTIIKSRTAKAALNLLRMYAGSEAS